VPLPQGDPERRAYHSGLPHRCRRNEDRGLECASLQQ
jgi:hypothetical protein